ncbi:nucleotidyltransferase domain-containing protein [Fervidibacter sacchari]
MKSTSVTEILDPVVQALRAGLGERLIAIVLFGSRARGEATKDSDWDLLVIANGLPEGFMERNFMLKRLLPSEWRGNVCFLVRTPSELENRLASLHLDIALDGKILYDPFGFAARWLEKLRDFIGETGLVRERVEFGEEWLWSNRS